MSILVTGSTGFIGKRLLDYLKKQGLNINTLVRKTSGDNSEFIYNLGEGKFPSDALRVLRQCIT